MTKVLIQPGPCGLDTQVEATSEDGMEVQVKITSGCESIKRLTAGNLPSRWPLTAWREPV